MLSNLGLVLEANLGKSEYTELYKLIYDVQTLVNRRLGKQRLSALQR